MEYKFTELDCEKARDIRIITHKKSADGTAGLKQTVFLAGNGLFRFDGHRPGHELTWVRLLPSIKIWVLRAMISDMLNLNRESDDRETEWEILAHDDYGNRFVANGFSISNVIAPKYDPSNYLREATGLQEMWLLDGKR